MLFKIHFFSQSKQWKILLTQVLIAFTMGYSGKAIALSVEDYCLSKVEPSEFKTEIEKPIKDPNEIWYTQTEKFYFSQKNKNYSIKIDYDTVQLINADDHIIYQLKIPLEKDSSIRLGYLTKDNWLYAHSERNNYAVKVNLENPDSYLEYDILPKIYPKKCGRFVKWFDGYCSVEHFSFHPSSNKVFLSGYMPTSDGQKWVVMEIAGGTSKILQTFKEIESIFHIPELSGFILQGTKGEVLFYDGVDVNEIKTPKPVDRILRYISQLNGVLIQGTKGEVLFYDGVEVKEISSSFPKQSKGMRDWYLAKIATFEGREQNYSDERIFITNFREGAKAPFLFLELKAGLLLKPVPFPKKRNGTEIDLFIFPDDSLLWAMRDNSTILAEIDGKFQNIITVPRFHTIIRSQPLLTTPISLEVGHILGNIRGSKNEKYYIKKVSPSANCEIRLDPDNPVKLTVD